MARQTEILGMRVQREYKGPAARLVELLDSDDRNHVGIVFYEQYRNHSALTNSLDGLMSFLQNPVARGITPLHSYGYEEGAFIYETGKCKSVAELIRQASDLGLSPGPRAGLELMTQALEVLQGALRIAEEYAIFSHGGLTPWRLMIRPDGKLQMIGFAVPQVEVLDYKSNPNLIPSEDSFRYAPPERMEMDAMEDFSSDLFAIALIGFEMMTTRPMYDGSISAIQESAQRADVAMRLNQAMVAGWLDPHTHDFLDQCLRLDVDDRFDSLSSAVRSGKALLRNQHLKGMSLFDLMSACSQQILRVSQEIETLDAATAMFDRNALAPEIMEMEAERKRQKLKEVTLGEPLQDAEDTLKTADLGQRSERQTPENLLDMLRQSAISKPVVPEIETPPPKPDKPQSGLGNDLLSALRSSVSQPVESLVEKDVGTVSEPAAATNEATEVPPVRSSTSNKLSSLLSAPKRSTVPKTEPSPKHSVEPLQSATQGQDSSTDTPSKLRSLLSSSKRQPPVTEVPPVSKSAAIPQAQNNPPVQSTTPTTAPHSSTTPPAFGESLDFGEALGEELSDEMLDEDCATAIMTRPTSPKPATKNPSKSSASMSPAQTKSAPLEIKAKPKESVTPRKQRQERSVSTQSAASSGKTSVESTVESNIEQTLQPSTSVSSPQQQFGGLQDLFGPPIPLRSTVPTINAQKYKISLGSGRGSIKQVCSPEITVSQLVSILLLNRLLPARMNLSGQVTSCYRVKQRGAIVSGKKTLSSLGTQQLMLASVPARTLLLPVEVHGPDGLIRFNTPVNWIVPMGSVIDYVVSWLRLPAGNWRVYVGDTSMDVHDVLFDVYKEDEACVLTLKPVK